MCKCQVAEFSHILCLWLWNHLCSFWMSALYAIKAETMSAAPCVGETLTLNMKLLCYLFMSEGIHTGKRRDNNSHDPTLFNNGIM